ncbi:MAG: hypothetical protein LBC63_08500 [Holophagales bacterium]|jgi:hypothetical protein|nr:hypothetical protein [Holophagales bacterium]
MKARTINHRGGALRGAAVPSHQGAGGAIDQGAAAAAIQGRSIEPAKLPKLLRNADWAYIDPTTKEFACRRCAERKPLERRAGGGPIDAADFLEQMSAFEKVHARCRADGQADPLPTRGRRAS